MKTIACALSIAGVLTAGAALAQGAPPTIPGGPYGENESLASLRSYDEDRVAEALAQDHIHHHAEDLSEFLSRLV